MMYTFRREDNGELFEVDLITMMEKVGGYITLPDGVLAKEVHQTQTLSSSDAEVQVKCDAARDAKLVSEMGLGFPEYQIGEFRADAEKNKFTGVEFVHEPDTHYYRVECSCPSQWREYVAHRGMVDRNGATRSKPFVSQQEMDQAAKLVARVHG